MKNVGRTIALLTVFVLAFGVMPDVSVQGAMQHIDDVGSPMISASATHTLALSADGRVVAWGDNSSGQLGDNTIIHSHVPTLVQGITNATSVAAGNGFSLAVVGGEIYSWGVNSQWQLGRPNATPNNRLPQAIPSFATGPAITIAAGANHAVALVDDPDDGMQVWTWGSGQMVPTRVTAIGFPANQIVAIAAGDAHTIALDSDGGVWTWGSNSHGQLGRPGAAGTPTRVTIPGAQEVTHIAGGGNHTIVVTHDRYAFAWGQSNVGQLGSALTANQSAPIQVGLAAHVDQVTAGGAFSVLLGGSGLSAFGVNTQGQLGSGGVNSHTPVSITLGGSVASIAAGTNHTAVLMDSGAVFTWGLGESGRLGNGLTQNTLAVNNAVDPPVITNAPVQVRGVNGAGMLNLNNLGVVNPPNHATDSSAATWGWASIQGAVEPQTAVTTNLNLPDRVYHPVTITGGTNSPIRWTSSNPAVVSATGVVTRPAFGQGNASAILTATNALNELTLQTFNITVLQRGAVDLVALDMEWITWDRIRGANPAMDPESDYTDREVTHSITSNLSNLPVRGPNNSVITWVSSNPALLSIYGENNVVTVNRPTHGSANATITLTATVTLEGVTHTPATDGQFTLMILAESDADFVARAAQELVWSSIAGGGGTPQPQTNVTENLNLISTLGISSEEITWTSSHPNVIRIEGTTGIVRQPDPDLNQPTEVVTLTATIRVGDETETVTFSVVVVGNTANMIVQSSNAAAFIDLTTERIFLPSGYTVAEFSLNGANGPWRRGQLPTGTAFNNLIGRGAVISVRSQVDNADTQINFPRIAPRPRVERLRPWYSDRTWTLNARPTRDNRINTRDPLNTSPAVNNPPAVPTFDHEWVSADSSGRIPANPEWRVMPDDGFEIRPFGSIQETLFFRSAPDRLVVNDVVTYVPAGRHFRIRPVRLRRGLNLRVNYATESLRTRVIQEYSYDAGTTWNPAPTNGGRAIHLDVGGHINNGATILIRNEANGRRTATAAQEIVLRPRAALAPTLPYQLPIVNGAINSAALRPYRANINGRWRAIPRMNANTSGVVYVVRMQPTVRVSGGIKSGYAASESGQLHVTWGVIGQDSRGRDRMGVVSAWITAYGATPPAPPPPPPPAPDPFYPLDPQPDDALLDVSMMDAPVMQADAPPEVLEEVDVPSVMPEDTDVQNDVPVDVVPEDEPSDVSDVSDVEQDDVQPDTPDDMPGDVPPDEPEEVQAD